MKQHEYTLNHDKLIELKDKPWEKDTKRFQNSKHQ